MTKKTKLILLIVSGVVLMLAAVALCVYLIFNMVWKQVDKYQIDEKTQCYLEAIVEADNEKLHTVSYDKDLEVRDLIDSLAEHEIFLNGEVSLKRGFSVNINIVNGSVSATVRYKATVGEQRYLVTVQYVKDLGGDGIQTFLLKPA